MACKLVTVSGMAFEAKIAQGYGIQAVYGLNPEKLEEELEQAIRQGAAGLLSFGVAAGLLPALSPGTIIVARNIHWHDAVWQADSAWASRLCAALPEARLDDVAGIDRPVTTVRDKALLHTSSQAAIADMESHRVARLAHYNRLPFAVLRVVLDGAGRTLPPAALAAVQEDGTIDYARLTGCLLTHPRLLCPMLELAANHYIAKKALLRCATLLRRQLFALHPF